jgi:hypothetical protein
MKRYHIVPIIVLVLVLGGFGGVYKFFLEDRFKAYEANQAREQALLKRLDQLKSTFVDKGGQRPVLPDLAVKQWKLAVQPWVEGVGERARDFNLGDSFDADVVPEDQIPKFYYLERYPINQAAMYQRAYQGGAFLNGTFLFGVPTAAELANGNPTEDQVNKWFREYSFGATVVRKLTDAGAAEIREVELWPPRKESGMLLMRTTGLDFYMTLGRLTQFLEGFYNQERYFNINSIRITNTNLLSQTDPFLHVEMVMTQGAFQDPKKVPGGGGLAAVRAAQTAPASAAEGAGPSGRRGPPGRNRIRDLRAQRMSRGSAAAKTSWWSKIWPF